MSSLCPLQSRRLTSPLYIYISTGSYGKAPAEFYLEGGRRCDAAQGLYQLGLSDPQRLFDVVEKCV